MNKEQQHVVIHRGVKKQGHQQQPQVVRLFLFSWQCTICGDTFGLHQAETHPRIHCQAPATDSHNACFPCFLSWITHSSEKASTMPLCFMDPTNQCHEAIAEHCVALLPAAARIRLAKQAVQIALGSAIIQCPCGFAFSSDGKAGVIWCPKCIENGQPKPHSFCGKCRGKLHPGTLCSEVQAKETHELKKLQQQAGGFKCPNPGCPNPMICVRDKGCAKLTCPACRHLLCAKCGQDITREGYSHFTCPKLPVCKKVNCQHCSFL